LLGSHVTNSRNQFYAIFYSKSKSQTRVGNIKTVASDICVVVANDDVGLLWCVHTRFRKKENLRGFPLEIQQSRVAFSEEAILDKLFNLKVNKSPGPDSVHPRILYEVRYQIVAPLHMIFETSYNIGLIPQDWKFANTAPIYNRGNKAKVNNSRLVSLTNVICKVMESIIRDHVVKYFLNNDLFSIRQYGFLKGRSTVLQLLKIIDD